MYEYIKRETDIVVIGYGKTLENAFEEGAKGLFAIIADSKKIKPKIKVEMACKEEDDDNLYVQWFNTLIAESKIKKIIFVKFKVHKIKHSILKATAYGDYYDSKKTKNNLKEAVHGISAVGKTKGKVFARCMVTLE